VDDGARPQGTLTQWLTTAGPALIVVPLALVTLRVLEVSHGNYTTELALINDGKPLTVLVGSLAPVAPYFVMYVALAVLYRSDRFRRSPAPKRPDGGISPEFNSSFIDVTVGFVAVAVVLVSTSVGSLFFALVAVCLWFAVVATVYFLLVRHVYDKTSVREAIRDRRATWLPTVLTAALAGFLVFQLGLDDTMWLPPQIVPVSHGWETVYVLDSSGPNILAMDATNRTLLDLSSAQLAKARTCYQAHGAIRWESSLANMRSILQMLHLETHLKQPTCGQVLLELRRPSSH
jgi:hypothetical protein